MKPMKTQLRVLFVVAALALLAGWLGLRRGNAALEARVAGPPAAAQEAAR
jgi:hypothetical protein